MHKLNSTSTEAEVGGSFNRSVTPLEELFKLAGFSTTVNRIFVYD